MFDWLNVFSWSSSRIRTRLLISLIFIVLIVVTITSVITVILGSNDGRSKVIDQLNSVATLKDAEINTWVNNLGVNLDIILSGESVISDAGVLTSEQAEVSLRQAAYSHLMQRFRWAAATMGLFEELFLMDTEGRVILSTNPVHEGELHNNYEYFYEGAKGKYIEQPSYSLAAGKLLVVASTSLISDGKLIGVLAGRANLDSLNGLMLERAGLGQTGETYLVGSNHRLLTDLRNGDYRVPETYVLTAGADAAVNNRSNGSATYLNYNGDKVIGVYRWVPELQVALLAEQGENEALQGTRTALFIIMGSTVGAIIIAVLIAIFITRGMVKPLAELSRTAEKISAGDLDLAVQVSGPREISIVASAFNNMTGRLRSLIHNFELRTSELNGTNVRLTREIEQRRQVEDALRRSEIKYRHIIEKANYIVLELDKKGNITFFNEFAEKYFGYSKNEIMGKNVLGTIIPFVDGNGIDLTQMMDDILKNPDKYQSNENENIRKNGERVWVAWMNQAIYDEEQQLEQILCIGIDRTDIKKSHDLLAAKEKEDAAIAERIRLARDLHDAVSQTLFSASIIADVLPQLWEKNQDEGRRRLEEIRQLTRGALAEMRTLLFELRPAALEDAALGELLRHLAATVRGRARVPVDLEISGDCPLPVEVKVALYRIAQEALNNVAKHSEATWSRIKLSCNDHRVKLIISDNGKGFDVSKVKPDSLGIGIMKERAAGISALLEVHSTPGNGTDIEISWGSNEGEDHDSI